MKNCAMVVSDGSAISEAERAAFALAQAGASHPNGATQAHFDALQGYFRCRNLRNCSRDSNIWLPQSLE